MAIEGGGDYRQRLVQRQLQIKKRKKAGLSDTRADAGPPSSKTFSSPPKREDTPNTFNRIVDFGKGFGQQTATDFALGLTKPVYKLAGAVGAPDEGILGKEQFLRGQAQLFTGFGTLAPEEEFINRVRQDTKEYSGKELASDILASYANFIGPGWGAATSKALSPAVRLANTIASGAVRGVESTIPKTGLAAALVGGGVTTRIPRGMAGKPSRYIPYGATASASQNVAKMDGEYTDLEIERALAEMGPATRKTLPTEKTTGVAKDLARETAENKRLYDDVTALLDPNNPMTYPDFLSKYPNGQVTLTRLDAENLIDAKRLGVFEPAGILDIPKGRIAKAEKGMNEMVTLTIKPRTISQQKNSLLRHGQQSAKRQKRVNDAISTFYRKVGIKDARGEIRQRQLDSFSDEELTRIWGESRDYRILEGKWSRVDHGDHLIARKRIENRILDLTKSVKKNMTKDEKERLAKTIEAYYEFQNSSSNFMGLNGMRNISKSDLESNEWLQIASTPYGELPPKFKPFKAEIDRAYKTLQDAVGKEEFQQFINSY